MAARQAPRAARAFGSLVGLRLRGLARDVSVIAVVMAAVPMLGIYPILAQRHGHEGVAAAAQLAATVASFFTLTALIWAVRQYL